MNQIQLTISSRDRGIRRLRFSRQMNAVVASSAHLAYPDRIVSKILLSASGKWMKGMIPGQGVMLRTVSMANAPTWYSIASGNRNFYTTWSLSAGDGAVGAVVSRVAGDLAIIWTTISTKALTSSNNPYSQ